MIELHMFLGRRIDTGENFQDTNSTSRFAKVDYYGTIPADLVLSDIEWIKQQTDSDADIQRNARSASAAMAKYLKTRPACSNASVKRAKTPFSVCVLCYVTVVYQILLLTNVLQINTTTKTSKIENR
jgi:hypothetical protein